RRGEVSGERSSDASGRAQGQPQSSGCRAAEGVRRHAVKRTDKANQRRPGTDVAEIEAGRIAADVATTGKLVADTGGQKRIGDVEQRPYRSRAGLDQRSFHARSGRAQRNRK